MASVKYIENSVSKFKDLLDVIAAGFSVTKGVAEDIEENENSQDAIKELCDITISFAQMERDIQQYCAAAELIKLDYLQNVENESFDLHTTFEEKLTNITSSNNLEDLLKHRDVVGILQRVETKYYNDTLVKGCVTQDDSNNVLIDETQDVEQKYICPIAKVFDDIL